MTSQKKSGIFHHDELDSSSTRRMRRRTAGNVASSGATFPVICRRHTDMATLLSSSPWSKMPDLPLKFQRYLS